MKRLILIAAGALTLGGCVSVSSAPYADWANKRCAEVAPDYDRSECVDAYVEARNDYRREQAERGAELFQLMDRAPLLRNGPGTDTHSPS